MRSQFIFSSPFTYFSPPSSSSSSSSSSYKSSFFLGGVVAVAFVALAERWVTIPSFSFTLARPKKCSHILLALRSRKKKREREKERIRKGEKGEKFMWTLKIYSDGRIFFSIVLRKSST
jgi:hypothetical protein